MDVVLNATLSWRDEDRDADDKPTKVLVYLGQEFLAEIPAVSTSKAGHGDDSSYFKSEDERVVQESIVAWLKPLLSLLNGET